MDESAKRAAARAWFLHQDGLISAEQARAAGFSASAVSRRLVDGAWVAAAPRVYREAAVAETARSRIRAAAMSVCHSTVVGPSATWWWRLSTVEPDAVHLAVPTERRPRPRTGVRIVRRPVLTEDVVVVDGLRVLKRVPALIDAAADVDLLAGARLFDQALLSGRVSLEELRDTHVVRSPRRGGPRVRELLTLAAGGARSQAERTAIRIMRADGIAGWTPNLRIRLPRYGPAVLDLAFPTLRVGLEVDGWAYHRDLRAFLADARRQNALAAAGWVVIRTNWYELRESPTTFVAAVRDTLTRRSRELGHIARRTG